jgi:Flp pilus assembly protein TadG
MQQMGAQSAKSAPKKRFSLLSRFRKDKRGSVAIEFSMLILPFTLMVFAIIETGLSFAAEQVISNASDDLSRDMRTGDIRTADVSDTFLFDKICDHIDIFVAAGCPELEVDLRTFDTYADVPTSIEYLANGDIDTSDYDAVLGGSETINSLRVYYRWPIISDFMRSRLSSLPNGKTLLFSSNTWRNEPYL